MTTTAPEFSDTTDAPFGRKADGTPYKRDPKSYQGGRRRGSSTPKATSGPTRRTTPNSRAKVSKVQERAEAVHAFLSIPVNVLAIAGQAAKSAPLVADAIVLGRGSAGLAHAVAQTAEQDDRIARVVDSLVQTGPYAALFGAVVPIALQIASHHVPSIAAAGRAVGLSTVDEVIASATPQGPEEE